MPDRAIADKGQTDLTFLHIHCFADHELRIKPGSFSSVDGSTLEQGPGTCVLVAQLHTILPVWAFGAGSHSPKRLAAIVNCIVAIFLWRNH